MKHSKTIVAGRLVTAVAYTVATLQDGPKERADKMKASSAAREALNLRYSWQKLEILLAANFTASDFLVTLTYDDAHLPVNRAAAIKKIKKWLTRLRAKRAARGQTLKYVYITEQASAENGRLHHHLVMSGTTDDYADVRMLWTEGSDVQIAPLEVGGDDDGYEVLARYLSKEPRECGICQVGARTWVPSMGLVRPKPEIGVLRDNETLTPPPGAYVLLAPMVSRSEFGEFIYMKYLLPKRATVNVLRRPPRKTKK